MNISADITDSGVEVNVDGKVMNYDLMIVNSIISTDGSYEITGSNGGLKELTERIKFRITNDSLNPQTLIIGGLGGDSIAIELTYDDLQCRYIPKGDDFTLSGTDDEDQLNIRTPIIRNKIVEAVDNVLKGITSRRLT